MGHVHNENSARLTGLVPMICKKYLVSVEKHFHLASGCLVAFAIFLLCMPATAQSGLPEAASEDVRKWAVVFDFDTDSCYPASAVSREGEMNRGLKATGGITGDCRKLEEFKNANTYCRSATIKKDGAKYTVYMYALYFKKDQWAGPTPTELPGSHRHDWEYALVWTKDGNLTHASFSSHGGIETKAKSELNFDHGKDDTVKVVYHKDGAASHCFRPADKDEKPENELGQWITPTLVEWGLMKSEVVSNQQLRMKFNAFDYGGANCSFNDKNFRDEIAKNPPGGYPSSDEWRKVDLVPPPLPK
jgi:Necrosis inducing protein (NPP1)